VAAEFTDPAGEPFTARAKGAVKAAFDEGLLLLTCGTYDNTVRWIPPLIVNEAQIKDGLALFERALNQTA
jgi:4-aminobutyrate aminotransferase